jgi:hypothetical protein
LLHTYGGPSAAKKIVNRNIVLSWMILYKIIR